MPENLLTEFNVVKQGDDMDYTLSLLLLGLKYSGIGCHLHGKYMEILGHGDNVDLLCPSIRGLNNVIYL